eukprot:GFKZ01000888.1.p2 GENE.GFKZ01000888.1~~GFKZ01000888.1.p2  ORF type:complete len:312 (-),score=37.11 GFKZ01000888.1:1644-2579(-)
MAQSHPNTSVVVLPSSTLPKHGCPSSPESPSLSISPIHVPESVDSTSIVPLYILRQNGKPTLLVEIVRFTSSFGSWLFVPQAEIHAPDVSRNGNITIVTAVDPLFAALLFMDTRRTVCNTDVFQPLNALCTTKDGVDFSQLSHHQQFKLICDVKQAQGESYYKLNDEKVIAWLTAKHDVLRNHPNVNEKDSVDILCQYLAPKWATRLRKSLLSDVDDTNTKTHNTTKEAKQMATATTQEDAKASSEPRPLDDEKQLSGASLNHTKKKTRKLVKRKAEKAPEAKFWACRQASLKAKSPKPALKRTRSASSTK